MTQLAIFVNGMMNVLRGAHSGTLQYWMSRDQEILSVIDGFMLLPMQGVTVRENPSCY